MREVGTLFSLQEDEKKKKKKMKMKRVQTSTSAMKTSQIICGGNLTSNEGRRRLSNGKEGGTGIAFGNGHSHGHGYGYGGTKTSATGNDLLLSSSSYVNNNNTRRDGNGNLRVRGGTSSTVSNSIHHSLNGVDAPKISISRGPNPLLSTMIDTTESPATATTIPASAMKACDTPAMGASAAEMMMMMSDHDKDMNGYGSSGAKRWRDGHDVQLPQWGHGSKRTRCNRSLSNTEASMKPAALAATSIANNNFSMAISSSSLASASASPSPSLAEVTGKEGGGEEDEEDDEDMASKSIRSESRRRRRRPLTSNGAIARAKLRGYGGPLPPSLPYAPSKLNNAVACSKEGSVDRVRLSNSTAQISGDATALTSDPVMSRRERSAQPTPPKEKIPPKAAATDKNHQQSNGNSLYNNGNGHIGNANGHQINGNGHHNYIGPTIEASPEPVKPLVDVLSMEWPRIILGLTRKEKEDDFLAMKGTSKLPQRPKKRLKVVEKALHYCTPGYWLTDLSRGRYDVREKKCTKKKARGLKHMESAESDSDS